MPDLTLYRVTVEEQHEATYYVACATEQEARSEAEESFALDPPNGSDISSWARELDADAAAALPDDTPVLQDGAEVALGELAEVQEALEEAKGEAIRRELQHALPLEAPDA